MRGQKVLLDSDLARLYGVQTTKALLQAVKRNIERFPEDFMLQLTADEWDDLRSPIVTSSSVHGGRRYSPFAFVAKHDQSISEIIKAIRALMQPPEPKRRDIGFTAKF